SSLITVTDNLPETHFNFGSASGAGWNCTSLSGVVNCTLPELAAGGLATINITGTVGVSTGTLTNTVWVTSSLDAVPGNNGPIILVTTIISKADQTITFAPLPDKTYGDADFVITATASSGLPVSFETSATDQCTNVGSTIQLTGAGSCTITATQAGNEIYHPALPISRTFTINPAATTVMLASTPNPAVVLRPITFTASVTSTIGTPTGTVQLYADGALLGAPIALSSGSATLITNTLAVGTHAITATYSGAVNYVVSLGTLAGGQVVDPARLYLPVLSR
ncbi:MAG TPA: Ig-like domain repeat protein, partial [Anaerolineae bacterium]|nr:Ig-like domain repeat protein [Anaerolineae bacterium]